METKIWIRIGYSATVLVVLLAAIILQRNDGILLRPAMSPQLAHFLLIVPAFLFFFGLIGWFLWSITFKPLFWHPRTSIVGRSVILCAYFLLVGVAIVAPLANIYLSGHWLAYYFLSHLGFFLILASCVVLWQLFWGFANLFTSDIRKTTMLDILLPVLCSIAIAAVSLWNASAGPVVRKIDISLPGLVISGDGYRIVQLSDVHLSPILNRESLVRVVEQTLLLKPNLVVITGDLIDGSYSTLGSTVLSPLATLVKGVPGGVYFVTGNHEYYYDDFAVWLPTFAELGVRVLMNEHVTVRSPEKFSGLFTLAGVNDLSASNFYPVITDLHHECNVTKAVHECDVGLPVILLAHQPRVITAAANAGVTLQLSGHTHGGQMWPLMLVHYLANPYLSGLHVHRRKTASTYNDSNTGTLIFVSSGVYWGGPPMRLFSQAEIVEITLRSPLISEVVYF